MPKSAPQCSSASTPLTTTCARYSRTRNFLKAAARRQTHRNQLAGTLIAGLLIMVPQLAGCVGPIGYRFVELDEAATLLDAELFARVAAGLAARATGRIAYLENGVPSLRTQGETL